MHCNLPGCILNTILLSWEVGGGGGVSVCECGEAICLSKYNLDELIHWRMIQY